MEGNLSADSFDINGEGNEPSPYPAPLVDIQDACTAANLVLADAGVRPLDGIDQDYLSRISLGACTPKETLPIIALSPGSMSFDAVYEGPDPSAQQVEITNQGGEHHVAHQPSHRRRYRIGPHQQGFVAI